MKTRKFNRPIDNDEPNREPGSAWDATDNESSHTPTSWIKTVMHEPTRTPEEVAHFAGPNAGYVLRAVNAYERHMKLIERFANFDCFKPWGVLCDRVTGGEEPCEACQAKAEGK